VKDPVRVLVVDDEAPARAALRRMLSEDPEVEVVGCCADGKRALAALKDLTPEVLFLDIRMPGLDGFQVVQAAGPRPPKVVFVTAHAGRALEAFDAEAVDYVLKPFDEERLAITVERLKARVGSRPQAIEDLVQGLAARLGSRAQEHLRWIKASVGSNVRLIPVEEVLFIQSDEKYTRVVTCDGESLIRKPIRELLDELDPAKFWQVHRATIVNVDHIASVRRGLKDQAEIALRDCPETLVVSRAFTHLFKQM